MALYCVCKPWFFFPTKHWLTCWLVFYPSDHLTACVSGPFRLWGDCVHRFQCTYCWWNWWRTPKLNNLVLPFKESSNLELILCQSAVFCMYNSWLSIIMKIVVWQTSFFLNLFLNKTFRERPVCSITFGLSGFFIGSLFTFIIPQYVQKRPIYDNLLHVYKKGLK